MYINKVEKLDEIDNFLKKTLKVLKWPQEVKILRDL